MFRDFSSSWIVILSHIMLVYFIFLVSQGASLMQANCTCVSSFSSHSYYPFRCNFKYVLWILWTSWKLKMAISLFLTEFLNLPPNKLCRGWLYSYAVRSLFFLLVFDTFVTLGFFSVYVLSTFSSLILFWR